MIVNSIIFLLFFVIVFASYYILRNKRSGQNALLLIASCFFYGFTNWKILPLLLFSILFIYLIGIIISKSENKKADIYTIIGIVFGVGLLFYFKYLNFFIESFTTTFNAIGLHCNPWSFNIIMPLGISFFTFKLISYVIDIKRKTIEPSKDFISFATYISFFPTILSGPIDKSSHFLPQLQKARSFDYHLAVDGCRQILWGMFKKMVIADNLSLFIERDIATSNGSTLFIVAIFYSIQIYADFSGYSDMAIGVGKLLGFNITSNFRYPYFSKSIGEFWRRWHISLLSWFREYIYFPLGGSRCSKIKVIRNTFLIFLVSGLWHGANWTFVIWGIFHALLFIPSILFIKTTTKHSLDEKTPLTWRYLLNMVTIFLLITLGWVIFRMESIEQIVLYLSKICSSSLFYKPQGVIWALVPFILSVFMFVFEWIQFDKEFPLQMEGKKWIRWGIYITLIILIVFYQGKSTDFIYFKF